MISICSDEVADSGGSHNLSGGSLLVVRYDPDAGRRTTFNFLDIYICIPGDECLSLETRSAIMIAELFISASPDQDYGGKRPVAG